MNTPRPHLPQLIATGAKRQFRPCAPQQPSHNVARTRHQYASRRLDLHVSPVCRPGARAAQNCHDGAAVDRLRRQANARRPVRMGRWSL